jgi:hypothetical protein
VAWPVGAVLGLRASLGSLVVCLFFLRSCSLAGVFSFFFPPRLCCARPLFIMITARVGSHRKDAHRRSVIKRTSRQRQRRYAPAG